MRVAALLVVLAGCGGRVGGLTVVHVTAAEPLEGVARLSIAIGDGEHLVREDIGIDGISLPPERTFAIETPASFSASLHVSVLAFDAGGLRLGAGVTDVTVHGGQRGDATVTLTPVRAPPLPPRPLAGTPALALVAGQRGGPGYSSALGVDARFRHPHGLACDASSRVCYVADTDNHVIRKLVLDTGELTTIAGRLGVAAHADGPLGTNSLHSPTGLSLDGAAAFLYIAERDAHVVTTLELATGKVSAYIGQADQPGAAEGSFLNATFDSPDAVLVDPAAANTIYVADTGNHTVRRIVAGFVGPISGLLAGTPGMPGFAEAATAGSASQLRSPEGLAIYGNSLYVADRGNHRVRVLDLTTPGGMTSTTTTAAGSDVAGATDGAPGGLRAPWGLAVLGGTLFIADAAGSTLRSLDLGNPGLGLSTEAGSDGMPGLGDGIGTLARFVAPSGLAGAGAALFVADPEGQAIRSVEAATGSVVTISGRGSGAGARDGTGEAAAFSRPRALVTDDAGHAFVADADNAAIRVVDLATQTVSTLAGALGQVGEGDGSAADARFDEPWGLTYGNGALWVSERHGQRVRRVDPSSGETSTVAGGYLVADHVDGAGADARFDGPVALAIDGDSLYVVELGATLRAIGLADPARSVRTVVGQPNAAAHVDGALADARIEQPTGLVSDRQGRLFLSEATGTIRVVDLVLGSVFTLAGAYRQPGLLDSCGVTARFRGIGGLGFDYPGARLLVADGELVRRVRLSDGCVTTLAGAADTEGVRLGTPPAALNHPSGLARDLDGALLVLDEVENVLLRLTP